MRNLRPLMNQDVILNGMGKITGSEFSLPHSHIAYREMEGRLRMCIVKSEMTDGFVRVKKSQKIIDSVADFLRSWQKCHSFVKHVPYSFTTQIHHYSMLV